MDLFVLFRYLIYVSVIFILNYRNLDYDANPTFSNDHLVEKENEFEKFIQFEGFNNSIADRNQAYIIPSIVHYINLDKRVITFAQYISILSAWLVQKADQIFIHCNDCNFIGKYWSIISNKSSLRKIIHIKKLHNYNRHIFGKKPGWIHHKSDVLRLLVLMNYGGIYLDNDMIILKSLDKYRRFEVSISWYSDTDGIGNQIFIANKNARFLRALYDGYRHSYKSGEWYWNGGFYATERVLLKGGKYLAHIENRDLGTHMLVHELYYTVNGTQWRAYDAIHLLINHRSYLDKNSTIKEFDEINIQTYNFTFGIIARDLLNRAANYSS